MDVAHQVDRRCISFDDVARVESLLDNYEIFSCIFLMYEDVEIALQDIHLENFSRRRVLSVIDSAVFRAGREEIQDGVLVRWARYSKDRGIPWEDKFLEALLIIKNYQCVSLLGKNKRDLITKFLPDKDDKSYHVNLSRKILMKLVDDLSISEWKSLEDYMILESKRLFNIDVPSEYCSVPESFLLFLFSRDILKSKNKVMKMDIQFLCDCLENCKFYFWASKLREIEGFINKEGSPELIPKFQLDSCHPGTLIIFNQQDYDLEKTKYEYRFGSEIDSHKLKDTFELLGFTVIEYLDKPKSEMLKLLSEENRKFCLQCEMSKKEHCFVVAILAHGAKEGVVCTDAEILLWDQIRHELRKGVERMPRLLISQACQGTDRVSKTAEGLEVCTDGGGNLRNLVEFHSCVPGFAAYRSKKLGSFFIHSLCKHILKYGKNKDFFDISMLVNGELDLQNVEHNKKRVAMIPEVRGNLSKKLYLVVPEEKIKTSMELIAEWEKGFTIHKNCKKLENMHSYNTTKSSETNQHQPNTEKSAEDLYQEIMALILSTSPNIDNTDEKS